MLRKDRKESSGFLFLGWENGIEKLGPFVPDAGKVLDGKDNHGKKHDYAKYESKY